MSEPVVAETTPGAARIRATWRGEHRFDTGRPDGPVATLDGSAVAGQSPVDALLSALAACSGIDIVDILAKRRTPVERLEVEVVGERRKDFPRRVQALEVHYIVDGTGVEQVHAERAIQLAFDKYCSVAASLGHDITVRSRLTLNGQSYEPVTQKIWSPGEGSSA